MKDREAWLNLTQETVIEPELPICDPHHHFWIHPGSRYLIDEFSMDIGQHRVTKTIFIECLQFYKNDGPEELRPVGETEYIDSIAGLTRTTSGMTDFAAGIVGFTDLTRGEDAQTVIDAHLDASQRFRGIRHVSAWHKSDQIHNAHTNPPSGLLADGDFLLGLACVEKSGLCFDAWVYHPQIPELTALARKMPGLTIVVNHMAGPLGIGSYAGHREAVFKQWKSNMHELASCENVFIKLGGISMTMNGFGWHKREMPPSSIELAQATGRYYRTCIELFGAQRCMFESNFPVDRASCSYTILWNAYKRLTNDYSTSERTALFYDTAVCVYRI